MHRDTQTARLPLDRHRRPPQNVVALDGYAGSPLSIASVRCPKEWGEGVFLALCVFSASARKYRKAFRGASGLTPALLVSAAPVVGYHNATTTPWPLPTFTGGLWWCILPRRSSGASNRYQRRSTAEIGTGLKIIVSVRTVLSLRGSLRRQRPRIGELSALNLTAHDLVRWPIL